MSTVELAAEKLRTTDVLRQLPGVAADLPKFAKGLLGMAVLKSTKVASIGLEFQRVVARAPQRPFLRYEGTDLSYAQANSRINRYAAVLAEHGVGAGDVVGILATNRPETLLAVLAAVKLGAAAGMLNHHQHGEVLAHSIGLLEARVLLVGPDCAPALESLPPGTPTGTVLGLAAAGTTPPAAGTTPPAAGTTPPGPDLDELARDKPDANPPITATLPASTTAFYVFTSGTTGLPKASRMTHFRWLKGMYGMGATGVRLRPDDVLYCCLPLYHNNALSVSLFSVIGSGATFALGRSFSASRFWDDIVRNDASAFCYIGEICRYLLNRPPGPNDRAHRLRVIVGNGLRPEIWQDFTTRFNIPRVAEFYGASECNVAFINVLNMPRTAGMCPLPYAVVRYDPGSALPLRDEKGRLTKVAAGEVGLLLSKVTDRAPFDGYTDADATDRKLIRDAFKPGDCWFDTGDLVLNQGMSHVAFVDRLGDTFRWKGENVATTEVEAVASSLPWVDTVVVYGVAIPGTDGRAGMAAIKIADGGKFDGAELARLLTEELPEYAVPLYVRLVDEVETTSTFKSRKVTLREEAYDPARVTDQVYVLGHSDAGYVEFYPEYAHEIAAGSRP